jgi:hypothetical protein
VRGVGASNTPTHCNASQCEKHTGCDADTERQHSFFFLLLSALFFFKTENKRMNEFSAKATPSCGPATKIRAELISRTELNVQLINAQLAQISIQLDSVATSAHVATLVANMRSATTRLELHRSLKLRFKFDKNCAIFAPALFRAACSAPDATLALAAARLLTMVLKFVLSSSAGISKLRPFRLPWPRFWIDCARSPSLGSPLRASMVSRDVSLSVFLFLRKWRVAFSLMTNSRRRTPPAHSWRDSRVSSRVSTTLPSRLK